MLRLILIVGIALVALPAGAQVPTDQQLEQAQAAMSQAEAQFYMLAARKFQAMVAADEAQKATLIEWLRAAQAKK